jgi:hypothetical protein
LDALPELQEPGALGDVAELVERAGERSGLLLAALVVLREPEGGAAPPPTTPCLPVLDGGNLPGGLRDAREALERGRRSLARVLVESAHEYGDPEPHAVEGLDALECLHQELEALAGALEGGAPA